LSITASIHAGESEGLTFTPASMYLRLSFLFSSIPRAPWKKLFAAPAAKPLMLNRADYF
jgi:hypothetical protein